MVFEIIFIHNCIPDLALSILFWLQDPKSAYPVIHYSFNNGTEEFEMHFDGQEIAEIHDLVSAVSALLAIFWVFSIEFPKCLKNTLTFLALRVLEVNVKIPSKIVKIINSFP